MRNPPPDRMWKFHLSRPALRATPWWPVESGVARLLTVASAEAGGAAGARMGALERFNSPIASL